MRGWLPVLVLLAGCARSGLPGLEGLEPDVTVQGLEVERVDFEAIEADLVLAVDNPFPFAIDLSQVRWNLVLADAVEIGGQRAGANLAANRTSAWRCRFACAGLRSSRRCARSRPIEASPGR